MRSGFLARIVPPAGMEPHLIFGRAILCPCVPSNTQLILAAASRCGFFFVFLSRSNTDPDGRFLVFTGPAVRCGCLSFPIPLLKGGIHHQAIRPFSSFA
jgi:hypothetical protein